MKKNSKINHQEHLASAFKGPLTCHHYYFGPVQSFITLCDIAKNGLNQRCPLKAFCVMC